MSIEPIPLLASPSVQMITLEPGLPCAASTTEDSSAGPNAVMPDVTKSSTNMRKF